MVWFGDRYSCMTIITTLYYIKGDRHHLYLIYHNYGGGRVYLGYWYGGGRVYLGYWYGGGRVYLGYWYGGGRVYLGYWYGGGRVYLDCLLIIKYFS
jgi:hypothetical protein